MAESKRSPEERADLFIAEFQQAYSDAVDDARKAAETTGTSAWLSRYADAIREHKQVINSARQEIVAALQTIQVGDTDEQTEKDIKDAVKAMQEERIRHQAWWNRAVMCYLNTVERCDKILAQLHTRAQEAEQKAPLMDRGLSEIVRKRIADWPKVEWIEKEGRVLVKGDPMDAAGAEAA